MGSPDQDVAPRKRHVFLMPDCCDDWAAVVVEHPTGVVYQHQNSGTFCAQSFVEGYLVPIPTAAKTGLRTLCSIFEDDLDGASLGGVVARDPALLARVREAVSDLGIHTENGTPIGDWTALEVDDERLDR